MPIVGSDLIIWDLILIVVSGLVSRSVPVAEVLVPVTLEIHDLRVDVGEILVRILRELGRPFFCVAAPCLLLNRLSCLNLVLDRFGKATPVDLLN